MYTKLNKTLNAKSTSGRLLGILHGWNQCRPLLMWAAATMGQCPSPSHAEHSWCSFLTLLTSSPGTITNGETRSLQARHSDVSLPWMKPANTLPHSHSNQPTPIVWENGKGAYTLPQPKHVLFLFVPHHRLLWHALHRYWTRNVLKRFASSNSSQ